MCRKALKGIFKVSERRMKTVEALYSSTIATTMSYGRKISQKRTIAYGWFSKFVDNCGDYMPHNGSIHLPHTLSKQMIYQTMKSQLTQQGLSTGYVTYTFASVYTVGLSCVYVQGVCHVCMCMYSGCVMCVCVQWVGHACICMYSGCVMHA